MNSEAELQADLTTCFYAHSTSVNLYEYRFQKRGVRYPPL